MRLFRFKIVSSIVVVLTLVTTIMAVESACKNSVDVFFYKEMEKIPEIDTIISGQIPQKESNTRVLANVASHYNTLSKLLTAKKLTNLSAYAIKEMTAFKKSSRLKKAVWYRTPETSFDSRYVIMTTLDTLPSHSPIVTRWSIIYAIVDPQHNKVVRFYITIRGERLE